MQKPTSKYRPVRFAVTIGIVFVALVASYFLIPIIIDGIRSSQWPVTRATIVSSTTRITQGPRARLVADVVYRYSVGDQTFTTNRYDQFGLLGGSGMTYESPTAFAANHPTGSDLEIHYKPSNPAFSVVEAGFDARHVMIIVMLGMLYYFSSSILRCELRSFRFHR